MSLLDAIQTIENGLPRAKEQLVRSEQRLATISQEPGWNNLSKTDKKKVMRGAKACVVATKRTYKEAVYTLAWLKRR